MAGLRSGTAGMRRRRGAFLVAAGDFADFVAQECAFDEGADGGAFVVVELVERGEVHA